MTGMFRQQNAGMARLHTSRPFGHPRLRRSGNPDFQMAGTLRMTLESSTTRMFLILASTSQHPRGDIFIPVLVCSASDIIPPSSPTISGHDHSRTTISDRRGGDAAGELAMRGSRLTGFLRHHRKVEHSPIWSIRSRRIAAQVDADRHRGLPRRSAQANRPHVDHVTIAARD